MSDDSARGTGCRPWFRTCRRSHGSRGRTGFRGSWRLRFAPRFVWGWRRLAIPYVATGTVQVEGERPADEPMFSNRELASLGVGAVPVLGSAQSVVELVTGYDYIAGEDVHRGLAAAGIVAGAVPGGKVGLKIGAKPAAKRTADVIPPAKRTSHQTVLGSYPDYVRLSDELHPRRFEIPPDMWRRMTPESDG